MSRKLVSFDWALKKPLRNKANFGILEGFLSELLFTDIRILEILECKGDRDNSLSKQNRIDIKVRDASDQLILIEVQYSREQNYLFRLLFGTLKLITEHIYSGLNYSEVNKVISISVLHIDFYQSGDYVYRGTTRFMGLHNRTELKLNPTQQKLFDREKVADVFPEHYIINIKNFDDIATDTLDQWIYFLKNEEIKENFQAKGIREAKDKLDILKLSPVEKEAYDIHLQELRREASLYESSYVIGEIEGREKGIEQGIEKGKKEAQQLQHQQALKSVKRMKDKGLSVTDISEFTGLTEAEVKAQLEAN